MSAVSPPVRLRVTVDREVGDVRSVELLDAAGVIIGQLPANGVERHAPYGAQGRIAVSVPASAVDWVDSSRVGEVATDLPVAEHFEPVPEGEPVLAEVPEDDFTDPEALLATSRVDRAKAAETLGIQLDPDELGTPPPPVCHSCGHERAQHKGRECQVPECGCEGWR